MPQRSPAAITTVSLEYAFDCNVDRVFSLLTDPDFLVDRSIQLGELAAECDVTERKDETVVSMTREVERKLPAFAAKLFVGSINSAVCWKTIAFGPCRCSADEDFSASTV